MGKREVGEKNLLYIDFVCLQKLSYVYPFSINSHTQLEIPGDLSTEAQSVLTEVCTNTYFLYTSITYLK